MFTGRDWDDEFAFELEILNSVQIIRLHDGLPAGVKSAGDRTQSVAGRDFVIAPPDSHVGRNRGNCAEIAILRSRWQVQFELAILGSSQTQQAWIQILHFARG